MTHTPAPRVRVSRRAQLTGIALVGAVALGLAVGNNTSLGEKRLTVRTGQAMLHNTENWLTSFDTGVLGVTDSRMDQLSFHAEAVRYAAGSAHGHGVPPCLREGQWTPVRIGYTGVSYPGGGGTDVVAWVECLGPID